MEDAEDISIFTPEDAKEAVKELSNKYPTLKIDKNMILLIRKGIKSRACK